MKIAIDISEKIYDTIMSDEMPTAEEMSVIITRIHQGIPLDNITDEQISNAFQIAIANYWEEKSKYLTPPPYCNCPIQERPTGGEEE